MLNKRRAAASKAQPRKDGRKPLLVYLQPGLIKQLKKLALDQDTTAYELTEQAVRTWLSARKGKVLPMRKQVSAK